MRRIMVFAAAVAFVSMANAQFYGNVATGRGGQISFYGGIASTVASPQFKYNVVQYDPYYGYQYDNWTKVEADKVSPLMGSTFMLALSSLKESSESFSIGAVLGLGYTQCQWQADFSAATVGGANDYSLWSKSNLFEFQLGLAGSYRVVESVSIDFAVGPHFLFAGGNKARTEKSLNGVLVPDADANEWHEAGNADSFGTPSIDIGGFARVGGSYHFTEMMWVGLAFQYRVPFFNFSTLLQDEYSNDGYRAADDYLIFSDIKYKGWSLMLTLGINFE